MIYNKVMDKWTVEEIIGIIDIFVNVHADIILFLLENYENQDTLTQEEFSSIISKFIKEKSNYM